MKTQSVLIYCTHGTYGRDDDAYGALLQANTALARGFNVTLVLVDEGVLLVKKGQNPAKIGAVNNINELRDFIDLGGKLLLINESLEERGVSTNEIIEGSKIITFSDLINEIENTHLSLTF
jgi:predicted peroxiredoxin